MSGYSASVARPAMRRNWVLCVQNGEEDGLLAKRHIVLTLFLP